MFVMGEAERRGASAQTRISALRSSSAKRQDGGDQRRPDWSTRGTWCSSSKARQTIFTSAWSIGRPNFLQVSMRILAA